MNTNLIVNTAIATPLNWLSPATMHSLGWALLHFLWQGAAIAALAAATIVDRECIVSPANRRLALVSEGAAADRAFIHGHPPLRKYGRPRVAARLGLMIT